MNKLKIFSIVEHIGSFLGWFAHFMWNSKIQYISIIFKSSICTAICKSSFKRVGRHTRFFTLPQELRLGKYIEIGSYCRMGRYLLLRCYKSSASHPVLIIGDHVNIGDYSTISCCNKIVIGSNIQTGRMVMITDNSHGHTDNMDELMIDPIARPIVSKGPVIIEDNVWIGEKVSIMPNVTIGKGCIIAANAVVTKSVPPYCIVGGCPARIIKTITAD